MRRTQTEQPATRRVVTPATKRILTPTATPGRGLLITGAHGFIGSRVAESALSVPGLRVRLLTRRPPGARDRAEHWRADLADPATLRGACEGIDTVVHCASRIGTDAAESQQVNGRGTEALVEEAVRAGVRRVVCLSTAAVHGRGPFSRADSARLPIAPASATSRSRADAERAVLAAGGTVLRPHLVYGPGDRWVVPALLSMHTALRADVSGGRVQHSVIHVDALARAVLAAALTPYPIPGAHAVNHPDPVSGVELTDALATHLGLPDARADLDYEQARARLAGSPKDLHSLSVFGVDHWFDSSGIWQDLALTPGPPFTETFAATAPWYRAHLGLPVPAPA
ncbi:NAD-dependent epimerase/dehydratase family protein [Streptomyces sp. NPDC050610]|uniref:NAD-dependent epimerase/dehydratase family protein n=1 Tax=Streptomyces sp. NPDC050610 TaxID=3157097 RepID=UPI003412E109